MKGLHSRGPYERDMCQYRPRYHLIYDPQRHEILLTDKESTARGSSFSTFSKKFIIEDGQLSVGRGLCNEKGETDGKSRVKPSNISVKYTK